MNILGIDTSTKYLSLSITKNKQILAQYNKESGTRHSRIIISVINRLFNKAKIPKGKIDCFAVGLGPGSFTGLRISVSLVKALALSLNKKVVGISSLDIIAKNVIKDGAISVILDARRGNLYTAFYENKNSVLRRKSPYLLISFEEWVKRINKKTYVLGDGIVVCAKELPRNHNIVALEDKFWYPDSRNLNFLAYEKIKLSGFDSADKILPIYLYPKECQVKNSNIKIQTSK